MTHLVGTEYCNTVGALADQYMVNTKLHFSSHIQKGIPSFMIRFALNHLKEAKIIKVKNQKVIEFIKSEKDSSHYIVIRHIYLAVEKGYWKKTLFPAIFNEKLAELMSYISTKDTPKSPIIELTTQAETFESYIEPILSLYNELMNVSVKSLTKTQLIKVVEHLKVSFIKSDTIGILINKIRTHYGLHIIDNVNTIKKIQSCKEYNKYGIENRIKMSLYTPGL